MKHNLKFLFVVTLSLFCSCKNFLEIEPPRTMVSSSTVFENDDIATSAVLNLYFSLNSISTGFYSITMTSGFSSDELINYADFRSEEFYENEITPSNSANSGLFGNAYTTIFKANAILEGLETSNGMTPSIKRQLQGETLFLRAFNYFYLVNSYGPIPLQLASDYRINRKAPRTAVTEIYKQIKADLVLAESLLTDSYPSSERVRANRSVVQAMLARVYLFENDWPNAEKYASLVIAKNSNYELVRLEDVFLKNSREAIWQLFPAANSNGGDGAIFVLTATPTQVSLRNSFALNAFESGDKRQPVWVRSFTNATGTYYYPFKYKVKAATTATEYTTILRLAELYLIRAEANLHLGHIGLGIDDINLIRQRPIAGSPYNPLPKLSQNLNESDAFTALRQERKIELFSEWGHRWLDLKRWGLADQTLSILKDKWQPTDILYPIPFTEVSRNPSVEQNDGY